MKSSSQSFLASCGSKLGKTLSSHFRHCGGNMTMISGLAAIPLLASTGLAVDYMRASRTASEIQSAADAAAALAAASAQNITGTASEQAAARQTIAENYLSYQLASLGDVTVSAPAITVGTDSIDVDVSASVNGSFINVLNAIDQDATPGSGGEGGDGVGQATDGTAPKTMDIHVTAHAYFKAKGAPACITTLDTSASPAFYLDSPSELKAPTCQVNVLSTSNTAAKVRSASSTTFKKICAAGGVSGTLAGLTPNCTPGGDELASMVPAVNVPDRCDATGKTFSGATITPPDDGFVFCGNNTLGGGKTTLNPGLYIIKDGLLNISTKTMHGTGVTFYFASSTSDLTYSAKEDNYLKAPASGPYAGLLMFQAPDLAKQSVTIGSADKTLLEGIIYTPS